MLIAQSFSRAQRRTESEGLIDIELSPLGFITRRTLPFYPDAETPGILLLGAVHSRRLVYPALSEQSEQATVLGEFNSTSNQMDQVTQQNAAMVEEATAASANLAIETEKLRHFASLIVSFKPG